MRVANSKNKRAARRALAWNFGLALILLASHALAAQTAELAAQTAELAAQTATLSAQTAALSAQAPAQPDSSVPKPSESPVQPAVAAASIAGVVTDTDDAAVAAARVTLLDAASAKVVSSMATDGMGAFEFASIPPGSYIVKVSANGFSAWKVKDVIVLHEGERTVLPNIQLGVESISTTVNAITVEDLAERQITAEEHQRILGILPNFYVSYVPDAAPLTRKQKFKLALVVSKDPVTLFTTGVTAGIEQWQGDFAGYGQGFGGYAQRYAATYGDRLSSTFLGAAALPSLLHQDPRYFYRGHGRVIVRALYAISTVVVCKGDNGHWQPNYSNVGGNLGAAFISTLYYPQSDQHSVQVTVDNTLVGVATGAFGTLFQEFLLHHFTHGIPPKTP